MKEMVKNNKGITLAALVITIIVMTIIASIAVYQGKEIIAKSKVQSLETNMLTIQAKARAYSEEIESKVWALSDKEDQRTQAFSEKGLTRINSTDEYTVENTALTAMGLGELTGEEYTVIFSDNYKSIDVKFTAGIKYNNKLYYKLSEIQTALRED